MPAYIMCPTLRALVESRECRGGGVRINVTFHLQQFLYSHLKEFPRAKPEGTPEGEGVYLTVHPELSPNTDIISF